MKYQLVDSGGLRISFLHVQMEHQVGEQSDNGGYEVGVDIYALIVNEAPTSQAIFEAGCDWAIPSTDERVVGVPRRELAGVIQLSSRELCRTMNSVLGLLHVFGDGSHGRLQSYHLPVMNEMSSWSSRERWKE